MNDQTNTPAIGDNLGPPIDLRTILAEDHAELRHELEQLANRANAAAKAIKTHKDIKTPADLDTLGVLIRDARALWTKADKAREKAKAPYLQAERDVQSFFATGFLERLDRIVKSFKAIGDDYQTEQDRLARLKAKQEAEVAREVQRKAEEAAREAMRPAAQIKAEVQAAGAAERAERAEAAVEAKPAELVRQRTESGVVASAKKEYTFAIEDYDAIPLEKLKAYIKRDAVEAAIRAAVKFGVRELGGVRIYEQVKGTWR